MRRFSNTERSNQRDEEPYWLLDCEVHERDEYRQHPHERDAESKQRGKGRSDSRRW